MSKKKWSDLTKLSPAIAGQSVYPKYPRYRVWRTKDEFNGLSLPKTRRLRHVACHCCGTVKTEWEYASWAWAVPSSTSLDEDIEQAIEAMRPTINKAYNATSPFIAKLFESCR